MGATVSLTTASGAPRLVLITCGGPFAGRTHHDTDNVIVYAMPI